MTVSGPALTLSSLSTPTVGVAGGLAQGIEPQSTVAGGPVNVSFATNPTGLTVGTAFNIAVRVSGANPVRGLEVWVAYDITQLDLVNVASLNDPNTDAPYFALSIPSTDEVLGNAGYSALLVPADPNITGTFDPFRLRFTPLQCGTFNLTFIHSGGARDTKVYSDEVNLTNVLGSTTNGTVTVSNNCGVASPTPTSTPVPATATSTNTLVPPTPTSTSTNTPSTNTPVPPTATATNTATNTPVPPTATASNTATNTPVPPTATASNTATNTPVAATNTPTNTATNTPVGPTNTPEPATATPSNTPVVATNTPAPTSTDTPVVPTNTPTDVPPTNTAEPPTATATTGPSATPVPPTATATTGPSPTPEPPTATPTTGPSPTPGPTDDPNAVPLVPTSTPVPEAYVVCDNLALRTGGEMSSAGGGGIAVAGAFGPVRISTSPRAKISTQIVGNAYCRPIAINGDYVTPAQEIGDEGVIGLGVANAVDIFGLLPDGSHAPNFIRVMQICMNASHGDLLLFASAKGVPRSYVPLDTYMSGEYVCAFLGEAGTVVQIEGS
ncbi:MAG: hypothetical protein IPK19_41170 [Chloroflexi bacterium]|nr:hypothetical protein [Chloroflexota bacterium]